MDKPGLLDGYVYGFDWAQGPDKTVHTIYDIYTGEYTSMDKRIDLLTSHIQSDLDALRPTEPRHIQSPTVRALLFMVINLAEVTIWLLKKHNLDTDPHAAAKMASTSERMIYEANGD